MIVFVGTIAAVIIFVTEAPTSDTFEVVAAETSLRVTFDGVTDRFRLIRLITAIIISVALPLRCYTDLQPSQYAVGQPSAGVITVHSVVAPSGELRGEGRCGVFAGKT